MAEILDLEVTIGKRNLKDSYYPEYAPFSISRGQRIQFDNDRNELLVRLSNKVVRRVKMSQAYMETFTKYI